MERNGYGLPNVLPIGVVEPIEQMDLVMAKIAYDSQRQSNVIEAFETRRKDYKELNK